MGITVYKAGKETLLNKEWFGFVRTLSKQISLKIALVPLIVVGACDAEKTIIRANEGALSNTENVENNMTPGLSRIEGVLKEEIEAGLRAGFSVMIAKDNKIVYEKSVGMADREKNIPISDETRFRIASMTKAVTTVAVMQLVESGKVLLSDPVATYIPAFANMRVATSHTANADGSFETEELKRPITVHHLLTHTEGLDYSFIPSSDLAAAHFANNPYGHNGDLASRVEKFSSLPLFEQPGEKYRYGYGTDIAGRVVEIASGMSLEDYMREHIFMPLGMTNTEFFLDQTDFERLATTYSVDKAGNLLPTEVDPIKPPPNKVGQGWMSGGGGLISTTRDYMQFLLMLLNKGEWNGERVLSPASVTLMLQRQVADHALQPELHPTLDLPRSPGASLGLGGYVIEHPGLVGAIHSTGQWGWEGYYDTSFFISPADNLAVILMAQHSPWERPESRAKQRVRAIAYGALAD